MRGLLCTALLLAACGGGNEATDMAGGKSDLAVAPPADMANVSPGDGSGADLATTPAGADLSVVTPGCANGIKDGKETDVDCGGAACQPCPDGKACNGNGDCVSALCTNGACVHVANCMDGIKNNSETDTDCGGGKCSPCGLGQACLQGSDCVSTRCSAGKCSSMAISFTKGASYTQMGARYDHFAVGDLNADGKVDVAVTGIINGNTALIESFVGVGDGTFGAPKIVPNVAGFPSGVAIGDFTGDNKADLVVGGVGFFGVLIGAGDGSFAGVSKTTVPDSPFDVAVGDFNKDGKLDAVGTDPGSYLDLMLGNGNSSLQAPKITNLKGPVVLVADWNGDGKLDTAVLSTSVVNMANGGITLMLGNGDGTFGAGVMVQKTTAPVDVAVGDLNGDKIPDLAIALLDPASQWMPGTLVTLLGKGDGTFLAGSTSALGAHPVSLALADFNGDGILDVVTANDATGGGGMADMSVLAGKGDGSFSAQAKLSAAGGALRAADVNGDGKVDLVVRVANPPAISVLLNNSL